MFPGAVSFVASEACSDRRSIVAIDRISAILILQSFNAALSESGEASRLDEAKGSAGVPLSAGFGTVRDWRCVVLLAPGSSRRFYAEGAVQLRRRPAQQAPRARLRSLAFAGAVSRRLLFVQDLTSAR